MKGYYITYRKDLSDQESWNLALQDAQKKGDFFCGGHAKDLSLEKYIHKQMDYWGSDLERFPRSFLIEVSASCILNN